MQTKYQARWVSKPRVLALRKTGALNGSIVVNSFRGFILVEPQGQHRGDGNVLPADVARFELDPAWCSEPAKKLAKARELLGL